jgi:hypothetical protein
MTPPLSLRQQAQTLKPREIERFVKDLGGAAAYGKGLCWTVPFFKDDVAIVELTDEGAQPLRRDYYIKDDAGLKPVSYTAGYVESLAAAYGLELTRDTLEDYLRFYLAFTRGPSGRVLPISIIDELPLREELSLIIRRKLQSLITPLTIEENRSATGCVLIGSKLLKAQMTVDDQGTVTLEAIALLGDTLPVSDSLLEA